ncbi:MAG: MSMEG_0565 family glycosyltransferase [Cyanobacteria bacterium P01_F01_bin.86]
MKIALLTYSTKPRGSVVHTWELAEALTDLGHTVCIYALDKDGSGCDRTLACPIRLIPAQPAPEAIDALIQQRIQEFVDFLAATPETFDIYHAQDCIGANALLQLREMGNIPHFVRTVHHVEDYQSPYLQTCQDKSIRLPDLCLCVSDRWQQVLQTDYGIHTPRVVNGVNLRRFTPELTGQETDLKAAYGLTGSPIYLTVGGIEPRKNSIRLLVAFAQVLQTQPTAQLVIAGGATLFDYRPYREAFFQTAAELGIAEGTSLVLPGVVPDQTLPVLYRCADVFCFPSVKEGWGLVVLEAIAAGLPVIVANQPPFTEFLSSDQAALVSPESIDQIAEAMLAVAQPERSHALSQNSRAILAEYTWSRSACLHIEAYERLLRIC